MAAEFTKMRCVHCFGKFEFPPEGIGRSAPCPHCGVTIVLSNCALIRNLAIAGAAVCLIAGLSAWMFTQAQQKREAQEARSEAERVRVEAERSAADFKDLGIAKLRADADESARKARVLDLIYNLKHPVQTRSEQLLERQVEAMEEANRLFQIDSIRRGSPAPTYYDLQNADQMRRLADQAERFNDNEARKRYRMYP